MATKNAITNAEEGQVGGDESLPDSSSYADSLDRLKLLSALPELTEEQTSEIRALLAARLPDTLCDEEDPISSLRAKLWSVMLLGLRPEDLNSRYNLVSESLHGRTSEANHAQGLMHFPKEDQRVLAADIKRTRQAYPMFKRDDVLKVVSETLERYCVGHGIRYKQGQHELIAPFVMLQDPPLPVPVLGLLFESFMSRYVSRWYVDDEIQVLLVSYRVFRVLLFYVDPGLAGKLDHCGAVPELYSTAWLITLFSRNLPLEMVARLWDVYLAVDDPALVFLLLASLLVRNREKLMEVEQAHMMPEAIQSLTVHSKQELEELIVQAREMLLKIPDTFLRTVRSCCSDHGNTPLDTSRSLFCESVRCASIDAKELLERLYSRTAGTTTSKRNEQDDDGQSDAVVARPSPLRPGPLDTMVLDIRPIREYDDSGAGHLGKSMRLDPSLMEMDDVLENWMQHFDGTRGTHVCLVDSIRPDLPPPRKSPGENRRASAPSGQQSSGIVLDPLWRRLLLGEGEEDWITFNDQADGNDCGDMDGRSPSSTHADGEAGKERSSEEDVVGFKNAKVLARKLHERGFPYVSILEGGMESVIEFLRESARPLEPTVINHEPESFRRWKVQYSRQSCDEASGKSVGRVRRSVGPVVVGRPGRPVADQPRGAGPRVIRKTQSESGGRHVGHSESPMRLSMRTDGLSLSRNLTNHKAAGNSWMGAEAAAEAGVLRVGVMQRLAQIRQGVNHGVGTVARKSAWVVGQGASGVGAAAMTGARAVGQGASGVGAAAMTGARVVGQGASGVGVAAMTGARAVIDVVLDERGGGDEEGGEEKGGNPSRGEDAKISANGSPRVTPRSALGVDQGAVVVEGIAKTFARAAEQGAEGIGTVARKGARVVKEGAGALLPKPQDAAKEIEGGVLSYEYTENRSREEALRSRSSDSGEGGEDDEGDKGDETGKVSEGDPLVIEPPPRLDSDKRDEREILLSALALAEAKGHSAVVRTLRSRLDMPREPSGRLRRNHEGVERTVRGARIPSMNSNDEDDEKRAQEKEIWKSIADLA